MNKEQILNVIKTLAMSQGLYGRLLAAIEENPEQGAEFLQDAENANLKDAVDFVMWFEE